MVQRDHSCQYPYCIHTATSKPCPNCGNWFCKDHVGRHSCKKIEAWQGSSAILNMLKPDQVKVDGKGNVRLALEPRRKPSRRAWHGIVQR